VDKFVLQNSLKTWTQLTKNFYWSEEDKGKARRFSQFQEKYGCKQSYKTNLKRQHSGIAEPFKTPKLVVRFHKSQEITETCQRYRYPHFNGKYVASILCETEIEQPCID